MSSSDRVVTLQVDQGQLKAVIENALRTLPVSDLTVENAPLEEVLADIFAKAKSAA